MSLTVVRSILAAKYDQAIADKVTEAYVEIEENFFIQKWKPSELDAGHFVESVRRIIEFEQNAGAYTPFSIGISKFSDQVLIRYEQGGGHESIRILIPRVLKAIYGVRNRRGVAHISDVSPNEMDATLILYSVKWVLAELIRLATNKTPNETQKIIDEVVERQIEILWKGEGFKKILDTTLKTWQQVLVLLYDETPQSAESLRIAIEYGNTTKFNDVLKGLHSDKLIHFAAKQCTLSPTGRREAEKIIKKAKG